jgi:RHS repeat-associated protein
VQGVESPLENACRYDKSASGAYHDRETNLHYNYFRDYDPSIGRYIQSDLIGLRGGINTYAYADNSPVIYIDPTGLYCIFSDGVVIKETATNKVREVVTKQWTTYVFFPVPSPSVPSPTTGFPWPSMDLLWRQTIRQSGDVMRMYNTLLGGIWRCYDDCGNMYFSGWGTKEGPDEWKKEGTFERDFPGNINRSGSPSPNDLPPIGRPRVR